MKEMIQKQRPFANCELRLAIGSDGRARQRQVCAAAYEAQPSAIRETLETPPGLGVRRRSLRSRRFRLETGEVLTNENASICRRQSGDFTSFRHRTPRRWRAGRRLPEATAISGSPSVSRGASTLVFLAVLLWLSVLPAVRAQWQTQSVNLKPGWNGVFMHVDATYTNLEAVVLNSEIEEVWLWNPDLGSLQFVASPQEPVPVSSQWRVWKRNAPQETTLSRLIGNAAYLVKLGANNGQNLTWMVKGKPVPPKVVWNSDGANLFGFSTVPANPPDFADFFAPAPNLLNSAHVFKYIGGPLSTNNPRELIISHSTPANPTEVNRGEAFWVSEPTAYNRYFGPFELILQNQAGVEFGDLISTYTLRIRNHTGGSLTVNLAGLASENPPSGQPTIIGQAPVLVRGALNATNLTYSFSRLSDGPKQWTLAPQGQPGSEVEVVLGLDRANLSGVPGDLYAGLLRFTDSLGFTQVDVPVSATKASRTGLWVGEAQVSQVRHNLTLYDRSGASPVATGTNTTLGPVLRPFSLRLLVFVGASGNPQLLQRVYYGVNTQELPILTTQGSLLNPKFYRISRRFTANHLPWSDGNLSWPLAGGAFEPGTTLATTVTTGANDQASNPFLHTYHPDHDNLNASFTSVLPRGEESFEIVRNFSLAFQPGEQSFEGLTRGGAVMAGNYSETISLAGKGSESKSYEVQGTFALRRVLFDSALVTQ